MIIIILPLNGVGNVEDKIPKPRDYIFWLKLLSSLAITKRYFKYRKHARKKANHQKTTTINITIKYILVKIEIITISKL